MTAIALLNAFTDPHLVADTLLTADGPAKSSSPNIWLPALGYVGRNYESAEGPCHVVRLARKTIVLPNQSGLLAFSGKCTAARGFWNSYSERWNTLQGYAERPRVDTTFLNYVLGDMGHRNCDSVSLLGVLVDDAGNRTPFVHPHISPIETVQFGTCFVSGSGAELLADIIKRSDARLSNSGGWPSTCHFSATEDLAEHIAAEMLYRESHSCNGDAGTPLAHHCGGFYEWYGISAKGVLLHPRRLDLHVSVAGNELIFSRAYFIEHMELTPRDSRTARYIVLHVTLIFDPVRRPLPKEDGPTLSLSFDHAYGVIAEQALYHYDDPTESDGVISGPCDREYFSRHFSTPISVDRIRVITTNVDGSARMARLIRPEGAQEPARLLHQDSALHLLLGPGVIDRIGPTRATQ